MSINTERAILKSAIDKAIIKLNNYLTASDIKQKYVVEWKKGEGEITNERDKTILKHYYTLSLSIHTEEGEVIGVYGAPYPIKGGTSILYIFEAELKAYQDLIVHGLGTVISVQHGMFLQLRKQEEERRNEEEAEEHKVNRPEGMERVIH